MSGGILGQSPVSREKGSSKDSRSSLLEISAAAPEIVHVGLGFDSVPPPHHDFN